MKGLMQWRVFASRIQKTFLLSNTFFFSLLRVVYRFRKGTLLIQDPKDNKHLTFLSIRPGSFFQTITLRGWVAACFV